MGAFIDLSGHKYNRLLVLTAIHRGNQWVWECACECGRIAYVRGADLKRERTKSCGCLRNELVRKLPSKPTHGHKTGYGTSPTYRSWWAMISRCTYPTNVGWKSYGGRGISVCELWREFPNFLVDMGERPSGTTLDRKDPNGNYELSNCRWASRKTQDSNRRSNVYLVFENKRWTCSEFARHLGFAFSTVSGRIRRGWTAEEIALIKPVRGKNTTAARLSIGIDSLQISNTQPS